MGFRGDFMKLTIDMLIGVHPEIRKSEWSVQLSAVSSQPNPLFKDLLLMAEC